jgi:rubredoxin
MSANDGDTATDAVMECRVCWQVYDPALGDDLAQVPPGTPFADLPADWRCPRCDGAKDLYLPVT